MKMQTICPQCKIILFSGSSSTSQLLEIAKGEGYDFEVLAKPVHPSGLMAKIRLGLGLAKEESNDEQPAGTKQARPDTQKPVAD
jgi:phosphoglycerate-specific signal transduction histidine kinase